MTTDAPDTSFFASLFKAVRSPDVSALEDLKNVAVTAPGRGGWATWLEVNTKIGSLEKVKVIVPFDVAVPTSVSPDEVSMYTVSRATILGSVIVIVIGVLAVGDVSPAVSQDTAKEST
jgi:hypothetical protein